MEGGICPDGQEVSGFFSVLVRELSGLKSETVEVKSLR